MPQIDLDFHKFKSATTLTPDAYLATGVRFAFDAKSPMKITAQTEIIDGLQTLLLRGENRAEQDWLGLEIDIPDDWKTIAINFRYAPAERIFPRVYYGNNGQTHAFDEPDRAAPTEYGNLRFSRARWCALAQVDAITQARLSLLLPARVWFAMGLRNISGGVDG